MLCALKDTPHQVYTSQAKQSTPRVVKQLEVTEVKSQNHSRELLRSYGHQDDHMGHSLSQCPLFPELSSSKPRVRWEGVLGTPKYCFRGNSLHSVRVPPDNLKHNQPTHQSQSVLPLILFGSDSSKMNMTLMSTNLFGSSFFQTVNLKSKWQLLNMHNCLRFRWQLQSEISLISGGTERRQFIPQPLFLPLLLCVQAGSVTRACPPDQVRPMTTTEICRSTLRMDLNIQQVLYLLICIFINTHMCL